MKIFLASDHAGFELKNYLVEELKKEGFEVEDLGPFSFNSEDDYPDWVSLVAEKVSQNPEEFKGIVLGGSGQGEAIVCNKFPKVRAVVFYGGDLEIIKLSKEHNNANVLSLGARFLDKELAKRAVLLWLNTPFSQAKRHQRRIEKILEIERKLYG